MAPDRKAALGTSGTSGITNIQNAFAPSEGLGPADYDARQPVTANAVIELPFGKGKALLQATFRTGLDEAIGGWQVSTLYTFRTGQSADLHGQQPVQYQLRQHVVLYSRPGCWFGPREHGFNSIKPVSRACSPIPTSGRTSCPDIQAKSETAALCAGLTFWDDDASVSKFFKLPKEGYRLSSALRHTI